MDLPPGNALEETVADKIFEAIQAGKGEEKHIALLKRIAEDVKDGGMCKKGKDHADILAASRQPELFSSAAGATSITSLPREFNEFFGGMINMDDPRHGTQRRIVSRGFTPRALARLEASVRRRADAMIDRVIAPVCESHNLTVRSSNDGPAAVFRPIAIAA